MAEPRKPIHYILIETQFFVKVVMCFEIISDSFILCFRGAKMSSQLQWMVIRNCSSFLIKRNGQTYSTVSHGHAVAEIHLLETTSPGVSPSLWMGALILNVFFFF